MAGAESGSSFLGCPLLAARLTAAESGGGRRDLGPGAGEYGEPEPPRLWVSGPPREARSSSGVYRYEPSGPVIHTFSLRVNLPTHLDQEKR
jgi:hypothetical protein